MSAIEPGRIRARGLGRHFEIAAQGGRTLRATLMRREQARPREFWALRNVDLDIAPGETFGIVGRNGSGKSTLLKLLARVFGPSEGTCAVGGRMSSLLEVGAGFHPEFSATENIYLSAAIYGIPRDEIAREIDGIIDFAELEDFRDQPVKTFSSGMFARLGFSVAMHIKPDVLLLDEALAVGDEAFVQKCLGRISEYRRSGGTMVLVTHDAGTVERICDRAMLLEHGEAVMTDTAANVIREYHRRLLRDAADARPASAADLAEGVTGTGGVCGRLRVIGPDLVERTSFSEAEPLRVEIEVAADAEIDDAEVIVSFADDMGRGVAATRFEHLRLQAGERRQIALEIPSPPFHAGVFRVDLSVVDTATGETFFRREAAEILAFLAEDATESGMVRLRGAWATGRPGDVPLVDHGTTGAAREIADARLALAEARKESALARDEASELRIELATLRSHLGPLEQHAEIQTQALSEILSSPTWRLAEGLKVPLRAAGILTDPRSRTHDVAIAEPAGAPPSGAVPADDLRISRKPDAAFAGEDVAVIAAYDVRRTYGLAVEHLVRAFTAAGWRTVVTYSTAVEEATITPDRVVPDVLISRDHDGRGWDFFSWRVALETCPDLMAARRLLVFNDSMIGPIGPLDRFVERLRTSDAAVIGIVESADPVPHIQSWGVAFTGAALTSCAVGEYYGRVGMQWPKSDIIARMEIPLATWFAARGLPVDVLCSAVTLGGERRNPSIFNWKGLFEADVPFVKRELFMTPMETIGKQPIQMLRSVQGKTDHDIVDVIEDSVASTGATPRLR